MLAEGWLSAVLVQTSQPLPTANLRVGPVTSTLSATVSVKVDAGPPVTGLFQVAGGDGRIIKPTSW
jgi:hypothetical protein